MFVRHDDNEVSSPTSLARDGFLLLPAAYSAAEITSFLSGLSQAISSDNSDAIRSREGSVHAARNVQSIWPPSRELWRVPRLTDLLEEVLGPNFGLVRILYFDKPPDRTWALPWHKDLTIAVKDNQLPSIHFSKPTRKVDVPHVEAPVEVLEQMLTARLHLDEVTNENGPLKVIPGSHRTGKPLQIKSTDQPHTILASPGDVLLMRPLLAHSSPLSEAGTSKHRRILHFEFASSPVLPDGYEWFEYLDFASQEHERLE